MAFDLFPFGRRSSRSGSRHAGRLRKARRCQSALQAATVESLEARALLAVTATLTGGDLVIKYNAAGDVLAEISSDGTNYTVTGTGLLTAQQFSVAAVTGKITVTDSASQNSQTFKVLSGKALANPLQVAISVENTSLLGGIAIAASNAGDVLIGSSSISLANDISTAAPSGSVTFSGAVTLAGNVAIVAGAGAGDITFGSTLNGTAGGLAETLGLTAGMGNVVFTGAVGGSERLGAITISTAANVTAAAITATAIEQMDGTGTTTLNGPIDTNAAAGVILKSTRVAINNSITTTNSGKVIIDVSDTATIAAAGVIFADGEVSLKAVNGISTAGDVTTTNDNVTFESATTLTGNVALATGAGAGNITFGSTLDGTAGGLAETLGLTAGTGNVVFTGAVGGSERLGAITISTAANVTAAAITATAIEQKAGTGTTTLNGPIDTNAAAGVILKGTRVAINNSITTTNSGKVIVDVSDTATIAAAGDILADEVVALKAVNGISTAGDVTTTNDNVTFESATTLTGNVALATGAGIGNITFESTLDGAKRATFDAGTGAVSFKGAVGSTQALAGITLTSAGSTTADSSIKLAKSADSGTDGLTVAAGVNNVKMTAAGSSISGFAGNGVAFLGGSTNSQLGGFTVSGNAGNGMSFAAGSYLGTTIASNTITNNGDTASFTGNGILVQGSDLMIGWDAKPASATGQNVISNNALNGIEISGSGAVGNTILSNSIFLNGQGLTQVVDGNTVLVGEGIALTAGGNGAQVAPTIYDVVRDSKNGKVHVQLTVPASGSYLVQLFASNATDEQGIFPVDVNGFQGRKFVGASPSGSPAPVGTGKPIISGTPVAGNTLVAIEVDASLVAAGDWITATATLLDGTTPTNTSGFSAGVQALAGQTFAAGSDGQAPKWLAAPTVAGQRTNRYVNELAYRTIDAKKNIIEIPVAGQLTLAQLATYTNQNSAGRVIRAGAPSLASGPGTEITLAPNNAANAFGTVTKVTRIGNSAMRLTLTGVSLKTNATGFVVLGTPSLPGARLYDGTAFAMPFTIAANSNQLTVAGDQTARFAVGQSISLQPLTPSTRPEVVRSITAVTISGGQTLVTLNEKIDATTTGGTLRSPVVSVGPATSPASSSPYNMAAALTDETMVGIGGKPVSPAQAMAFVTRFQGGMRVASADVNGDGYVDLVTAPGDAGQGFNSNVFGDAPRIITIYNGNPNGTWRSSSINVSGDGPGFATTAGSATISLLGDHSSWLVAGQPVSLRLTAQTPEAVVTRTVTRVVFSNGRTSVTLASPIDSTTTAGVVTLASYTGGFQVSLGNLRPEKTGLRNAVAELVVASANNVFVYEMDATSRGAKPIIDPVAKSVITTVGSVTGLAAGTFTDPVYADIIVATTTAGPTQVSQWLASADASQSLNRPGSVTVYSAAANFAPTSTFTLGHNLSNGAREQNVFIGGASLAVGDVDNAPDQKPELILGAGFMGMGNFRVLANDVVVTGNQATIDAALSSSLGFGRAPRGLGKASFKGNPVTPWQPTGGPDFFVTNKPAADENLFQPVDGITVAPTGAGFNAPLSVAAVQTGGDFKARVFAAFGATNGTKGTVRAFTWLSAGQWIGEKVVDVEDGVGTQKGRLLRGNGLRLG